MTQDIDKYIRRVVEKHYSNSGINEDDDIRESKFHAILEVEGIIEALEKAKKILFAGSSEWINDTMDKEIQFFNSVIHLLNRK